MRKLSLLLLVGLLFSCHPEKPPMQAPKDPAYKKAKSFLYKQNDSAFYYFNKVVTNAKDSSQIAYAYNYMAFIQSEAGDYFGSQESLSMSLRFLENGTKKDQDGLASTYNVLGLNSLNLKNYDEAVAFFDKAIQFSKPNQYRLVFLNNKALAYQKKGAYPEALKIYRATVPQTKEPGAYARILTNMATVQWLYHSDYYAAPELLRALQIREKEKDSWGQNSSYAHLADYYMASRPDSALFYAEKMYAIARSLNSPDDQLEALDKLIRVGPLAQTRSYFKRYQQLNDSLQTARNAAKNQFALIRYNTEKSKADNFKLQKENTEKQYQITRQKLILAGSVLAFIGLTIMITYWNRKRKQQAVYDTQLRLANKVHNRLANGLYQLIQEVDNQPALDREHIVQQLDVLYERSRDISHEPTEPSGEDIAKKINRLLTAFTTSGINLAIIGNDEDCWKNIDPSVVFEMEQILQEWMVNMKKHSRATNVGVRFERLEHCLDIYYTDNGIGFPKTITYGNGLRDTENRIKVLGGQLIFDNKLDKGVKIHLTLPLT